VLPLSCVCLHRGLPSFPTRRSSESLRRDRAVGMLAYGQSNEILQPDRGERQFNRILETLAVLRAEGEVPVQDMLYAETHLFPRRSEEHTSELQSRENLVCRLLLEKK